MLPKPSSPYLLSATITHSMRVSTHFHARTGCPCHGSRWRRCHGTVPLPHCEGRDAGRDVCSPGHLGQAGRRPRRQTAAQSAALAKHRGQLRARAAGHRSCQHCGTEQKNTLLGGRLSKGLKQGRSHTHPLEKGERLNPQLTHRRDAWFKLRASSRFPCPTPQGDTA